MNTTTHHKPPAHPHLNKLLAQNEAFEQALDVVFSEHGETELLRKPAPTSWSIAETAVHLHATLTLYLPALRSHLEGIRERNNRSMDTFRPTWFGKLFIGYIVPENQRAIPTVKAFTPQIGERECQVIKKDLQERLNELNLLIRESDGWALNGKKFASPVSRLIRFTLGEGLWLQVAHNQRHLLQMNRAAAHFKQQHT